MPPRAVASPKKKRSKRKASDASKASLPKKPCAANPVEIPSMPVVSLGGRNAQLEKIGVVLEAQSQNWKPKGTTSLGMVNPQNGGRFGFAASTTTHVVPPGGEPNPQVLNNPYLEQRNQNTFTDHSHSSQPQTTATLSDYNIDLALREEGDVARQGLHARLVGSNLEDSDSSGSGTNTDIDKDEDEEGEDEGKGKDEDEDKGDEGENNESQFGWGEAHQRQKGHPGFSAEGLPTQVRVARPLTPDFEFQYSCDEDEDSAWMHLNNSNQPLGTLPGVQQEQSDPQTNTSKAEDVLKRHHKKNGQPHLPDPEMLQLLNQVAESVDQVQCWSKSKKPKGSDRLRPDQLAWYGPCWKSFLKEAKGECHGQHALENPFPPLVKEMPGTISEVLLSVLVAWDKNGRQFEAGVWPEQQYNMTQLFHCVFDSLEKNGNGKRYPNFSSKEYSPIYWKILNIIKNTLKDEYHGPRLSAQLREWAKARWAKNLKLNGSAMEARHDHLQVILD
ncbi:uncharacterized protein BJ212DRAFT_1480605 [Suillus subaureus]|uniref:Uncharacterized protein n=1 Tax=Suillus subaureus TaxID=48587 RepID=A0A9P7EBK1_9AGAM|nr:uncharacterized protein BJ212DRAFT_1480605 [Suillus subaureus]KAG1816746.1 hypothetical protein BJ212DRAFT_1480605 [Suillus subaureus]